MRRCMRRVIDESRTQSTVFQVSGQPSGSCHWARSNFKHSQFSPVDLEAHSICSIMMGYAQAKQVHASGSRTICAYPGTRALPSIFERLLFGHEALGVALPEAMGVEAPEASCAGAAGPGAGTSPVGSRRKLRMKFRHGALDGTK